MSAPTNWSPSEKMQAALKYAQSVGYEYTVTMLCREADVHPTTWYEYYDNPRFVQWWGDAFERYFAMQVPRLNAAAVGMAMGTKTTGNVTALKLMIERHDKGYMPRSKQEITGAGGAPLKTYVQVDVNGVVEGKKPEEDGE